MDEDGYFWFVGRVDDVINTAGHLVGPFEVESMLIEPPAVAEAAVIGVPDPLAMEVVKAFVSLKDDYTESEELRRELIRYGAAGSRASLPGTSSSARRCPRRAAARSCGGCSRPRSWASRGRHLDAGRRGLGPGLTT